MLDEPQFRVRVDEALDGLARRLGTAGDEHGFDVDFRAGALTVEFDEPPAKFVVSPQTATRQVWVSAGGRSYKLDWDGARRSFVLGDTGQTLDDLLAEQAGRHLGQTVEL